MKTTFLSILISPWILMYQPPTTGQELFYQVQTHSAKSVPVKKLQSCRTLADFWDGYPTHWISRYVSSTVLVGSEGRSEKAISLNDTLTPEQIRILSKAVCGSDIEVQVRFMAENPVTHAFSERSVQARMTVAPGKEAEFSGGSRALRAYLYDHVIEEITPKDSGAFQPWKFVFTVNEEGFVSNIRVEESGTTKETGVKIQKTLESMPRWKPALDVYQKPIKQEFELIVGSKGC